MGDFGVRRVPHERLWGTRGGDLCILCALHGRICGAHGAQLTEAGGMEGALDAQM